MESKKNDDDDDDVKCREYAQVREKEKDSKKKLSTIPK